MPCKQRLPRIGKTGRRSQKRQSTCPATNRHRPTEEDYADLADRHESEWMQRACDAVAIAVQEAQAHRGELIVVDIDKVSAAVAQDFGVSVTVVEEYAERWIIIDRLDTDKQPVDQAVHR